MIIALYVDDLLIFSNEAERKNVKKVLSSEFEMKDLGDVRKVIGVRIRKENDMMTKAVPKSKLFFLCKRCWFKFSLRRSVGICEFV